RSEGAKPVARSSRDSTFRRATRHFPPVVGPPDPLLGLSGGGGGGAGLGGFGGALGGFGLSSPFGCGVGPGGVSSLTGAVNVNVSPRETIRAHGVSWYFATIRRIDAIA